MHPLDEPTTIEILLRLGHHTANSIREWHAVRLSTVSGESAHFASHNRQPPVPIGWTLPARATVEITAEIEGEHVTLRSGDELIASFTESHLGRGGVGLLVREGQAVPEDLWVSGNLLNTQKVPGIATGHERWGLGWVVGAPLALWLLLALLGRMLGLWWGISDRFALRWLGGLAAVLTVIWVIFARRWSLVPSPTGPTVPVFVMGLTAGLACLGLYIPLAAHEVLT